MKTHTAPTTIPRIRTIRVHHAPPSTDVGRPRMTTTGDMVTIMTPAHVRHPPPTTTMATPTIPGLLTHMTADDTTRPTGPEAPTLIQTTQTVIRIIHPHAADTVEPPTERATGTHPAAKIHIDTHPTRPILNRTHDLILTMAQRHRFITENDLPQTRLRSTCRIIRCRLCTPTVEDHPSIAVSEVYIPAVGTMHPNTARPTGTRIPTRTHPHNTDPRLRIAGENGRPPTRLRSICQIIRCRPCTRTVGVRVKEGRIMDQRTGEVETAEYRCIQDIPNPSTHRRPLMLHPMLPHALRTIQGSWASLNPMLHPMPHPVAIHKAVPHLLRDLPPPFFQNPLTLQVSDPVSLRTEVTLTTSSSNTLRLYRPIQSFV